MTDEQRGYLQALSDLRSWHRWQIGQALGDVRTVQAHEDAIAYLDLLVATKKQHATEANLSAIAARVRCTLYRPSLNYRDRFSV